MATDSMMPLITAPMRAAGPAAPTSTPATGEGMELLAASTRTALGAAQALGGASLAFWQCRLKSGLETTARLAECRSPEDPARDPDGSCLGHGAGLCRPPGAGLARSSAGDPAELPAPSRALVPVPAPGALAA